MAEIAALARPYAEAAFDIAQEKNDVDGWSNMLEFLDAAVQELKAANIVNNPRVPKSDFEKLILDIGADQLTPEGINFVRLLTQNGRISLMGEISSQFEKRRSEIQGSLDVSVATALPMSAEDEQNLASKLSASFNKQVKISVTEDPSLIGGVVIRAGDKIIDGSLSGQIQQLAKQLT